MCQSGVTQWELNLSVQLMPVSCLTKDSLANGDLLASSVQVLVKGVQC